jgi:replication factor C subunit 2/4
MLSTAPTQFSVPFVEKYRPETLADVVGNTIAID